MLVMDSRNPRTDYESDDVRDRQSWTKPEKLSDEERSRLTEKFFSLKTSSGRSRILDVLEEDCHPQAIALAIKKLQSQDPIERVAACELLYQPGAQEGLPYWRETLRAITELLEQEQEAVVLNACMQVIGSLAMEYTEEELERALLSRMDIWLSEVDPGNWTEG